jgi:penicillin-binding protein 1B
MALIVEARYDKAAILEAYLNEIYPRQRGATAVHGVGEAPSLLREAGEPAVGRRVGLLAAIIQSPNGISPYPRSRARAASAATSCSS